MYISGGKHRMTPCLKPTTHLQMTFIFQASGFSQSHVCRLVERAIKDSECLDLESLTLVAGEQVWGICCDIRVLSFHGNLIDATNLAVVSML
jgi:exosome complex RNA-binding protein Rrp42 (RNase PH superfamily)